MTPNVSEHASMVNDVGGLLMVLDRCWEVVLALFGLPHFFFHLDSWILLLNSSAMYMRILRERNHVGFHI